MFYILTLLLAASRIYYSFFLLRAIEEKELLGDYLPPIVKLNLGMV